MDARGPQRHKRDTVRRFSTAANPWGEEEHKRTSEPVVEQQMGRRGTMLVIHARRNHPLTLKSPSSLSPSSGYSLHELLSLLLESEEAKRDSFQNAFLLLHQMFVTSLQLLDLLAVLYKQQPSTSRRKVVMVIQKWLSLYPEDFVNMKMRFKLRAMVLEMIQGLDKEHDPLRDELRATLRLSEQAHMAIRPPSYYVEQSVKQIEAARAKDSQPRPKNLELPDDRAQSAALPRTNSNATLDRMHSSSTSENGRALERVCSNGNLAGSIGALERVRSNEGARDAGALERAQNNLETGHIGALERARSDNLEQNSEPFPRGSIHQTLKAQHYDPFSDAQQPHDEEEAGEELDVSRLPTSPRPFNISEPRTNGGRHWKGSDFLLELSPAKVCAALTVLDHINLRAIRLREFSNKQWTRPDALTKAPNVVAMVEQYNARSYWVAAEILILRDQAQRVKAMRFFIDLAQECANAKNYFAVFSIIHGLNQSPLFRLQADWDKLPKSSKACLSALKSSVTEPSNNFKVYKAIKHQAQIPHLAYYTKLCFVYDELPLLVGPDQKINWDKKIFAIYNVLEEFQSCQKQDLKIGQDSALLELLGRLTRAVHYAATSIKFDAMWTLSFQYLPKPGRDANVIPLEHSAGQRLAVPTA